MARIIKTNAAKKGVKPLNTGLIKKYPVGGQSQSPSLYAPSPAGPQIGTAAFGQRGQVESGIKYPSYITRTRESFSRSQSPKSDGIRGNFDFGKNLHSPTYSESPLVKGYRERLRQMESVPPAGFQSRYAPQIDNILNGILQQKSFDVNTDKNYERLYNAMKESYLNAGNKAMRDNVGAASALTGGYGSSYAQAAGAQAYDNYLQGLNAQNVNLANIAYRMYQDDQANKYNQLRALQGLDDNDYGRHRDSVADYMANRGYYSDRLDSEYGKDYGRFKDRLDQFNFETQFNYNKAKDELGQRNYEKDFNYRSEQDRIAQGNVLADRAFRERQAQLAQQNFLDEFGHKKSQDALAQENFLAEFNYKKEQDALGQAMAQQRMATASARRGGGGGGRGGRRGGGSSRGRKSYDFGDNSTAKGGWHPLAAGVFSKLKSGAMTNKEAYDRLIAAVDGGLIPEDQFDEVLSLAGVDERAAIMEEQGLFEDFKGKGKRERDNSRAQRLINDSLGKVFRKKGK